MNDPLGKKKVTAWAKEQGWPLPGAELLKAVYVALAVQCRCSLISHEIDQTTARIMLLNERIETATQERNLTAVVLLAERRAEEKIKLASLERLLEQETPMSKPKEREITQAMIDRAKEYPFESLLPEELRRGRCRCPIHDGKNSMSFEVKNNYGRCFSCGWHGDTLKYVMDTQGKTFPEAVRALS